MKSLRHCGGSAVTTATLAMKRTFMRRSLRAAGDSNRDSNSGSQRLASAGSDAALRPAYQELTWTMSGLKANGLGVSSSNGSSNTDGLTRTAADRLRDHSLVTPNDRTDTDGSEHRLGCLLIRGFGVQVPGGAPVSVNYLAPVFVRTGSCRPCSLCSAALMGHQPKKSGPPPEKFGAGKCSCLGVN
jgi:hypothetical protein